MAIKIAFGSPATEEEFIQQIAHQLTGLMEREHPRGLSMSGFAMLYSRGRDYSCLMRAKDSNKELDMASLLREAWDKIKEEYRG